MKIKLYAVYSAITVLIAVQGCDSFIDVIPDNIPTIDHAFSDRVSTERYLITCYAGVPPVGNPGTNPAFLSGDEFWSWNIINYLEQTQLIPPFRIARGEQNANDPYLNYYEGELFKTIRKCNTFIERVDDVFDIPQKEKSQWKAEAKAIKAYCIFYLMRMYGPIPLVKESLSISASPEEVKYTRSTFDECVTYVTSLLDEASPFLLSRIDKRQEQLGRITKPAALSMKAEVLVLAASPQFNGNPMYANWANKDGQLLFGEKDDNKWATAAAAIKDAIDAAEESGAALFTYQDNIGSLTTAQSAEYTFRGIVTDDRWNNELIWGDINSNTNALQSFAMPYLDVNMITGGHMHLVLGVNMKVANQFYTSNGVPISEDKDWSNRDLTEPRTAVADENPYIVGTTATVNFDREPRFYGSLGFDRSTWYGNGEGNGQAGMNPWILLGLKGQAANKNGTGERSSITGYFAKKLINIQTTMREPSTFTARRYPFPIYRLADLYLLYAEALNEVGGPSDEVYHYIDKVRSRAGLDGVVATWTAHSLRPTKPSSKDGLRDIIQNERMIELAFEGKRFWDLRRWLLSEEFMNAPVTGWNVNGEDVADYYQIRNIYTPQFTFRDYLWPIRQYALTVNPNLVQAPGWAN